MAGNNKRDGDGAGVKTAGLSAFNNASFATGFLFYLMLMALETETERVEKRKRKGGKYERFNSITWHWPFTVRRKIGTTIAAIAQRPHKKRRLDTFGI